jgi:hypothetical protein
MDADDSPSKTWEEIQALKDDLFERAKYGKITGAEADAEAVRLGLGPFSSLPSPDQFDPMAQQSWTLPMAVNWIAFRTIEAARNAWPAYREGCRHWVWRKWRNGPDGDVYEGWFLEQWLYPSLLTIEMADIVAKVMRDDAPPAIMSVRQAREALWVALAEGMLIATAVPRSGGARMIIPQVEWPGLSPKESDQREELSGNGFSLAYVDMTVPSRAVKHLWGPRREQAGLPPLVRPDGFGYMPLSCAAQWIATEGGTREFDPRDETAWRAAFDQLLGAIASEVVRVVGTRAGGREPVAGFHFAGIVVDYPFAEAPLDLIMSETVYLQCYPYIDEEHWQHQFHDSLVSRRRDQWTHLMVEKGDVRAIWPFGSSAPIVESGSPGRPTSAHLYFAELERRADSGELDESIVQETKYLSQWLATKHPDKPQAKPKSIEAAIRTRYYDLRGRK